MNDNDIKFQKSRPIAVLGLHALLDSFVMQTALAAKQGDMDPCHKSVATMATLVKLIKEADTHNDKIMKDSPSKIDETSGGDTERLTLDPEELRLRLTRYLARLDADISGPIVVIDHD